MSRRHKRNPAPPRLQPEPLPPTPSAPVLVVLSWMLPPDVAPRQAEHALELTVMRGQVSWWAWRGERILVRTGRIKATLAALCPVLGQPLGIAFDEQTP